ncbi:MAG: VanW family protein [Armatimonadia bacterium]
MNKMRTRVLKTVILILLAFALLVVAAALTVAAQARSFKASGRIADNVTISDVEVGGLKQSEAMKKLQDEWLPTLPAKLTLKHGSESLELSAEELGREPQIETAVNKAMLVGREGGFLQQFKTRMQLWRGHLDIPVAVNVDNKKLQTAVANLAAKLDQEPVDARVTVTGAQTVSVIPGKVGIKLDQKTASEGIAKALKSLQAEPVTLTSRKQDPKVKASDLANLEVVLGSYSTPYNSGKVDRSHNLKLAVEAINGTVIMAGQVFSTDQAIGPRIEARGFREAPIFADGEVTPATGGGICQIASTIYNAALFADLPVTERHKHSQPVTYTPAGRDATVYSGSFDLRFRNDTGYPVVLLASMGGSRVNVSIIGKKEANRKVRIERSPVTRVPFEKQEIPDPALPLGKKQVEKKGRPGLKVTVYQIVKQPDGSEERRTLHTDVYRPQKEVVRVGTKKPVVPPGMKLMPDGKLVPIKPGAKPVANGKKGKAAAPATVAKAAKGAHKAPAAKKKASAKPKAAQVTKKKKKT